MQRKMLLAIMAVFGLGASEMFGGEVAVGHAMHVGTRKYDQDRCCFSDFKINDIQYHLAIVADGHGSEERGHEVSEYVKNNMDNIIQQELKVNEPHQALLNAFAACEKNILRSQKSTQKEPGATVTLSLVDLTNKKRYIANLGDSRTSILNSKTGEVIFKTVDHTLEGSTINGITKNDEYNYVITHGGQAQVTNFAHVDVVLNLNGMLEHLAVPRALGDAHFKPFIGEDGTVGPVNPVPQIYKLDINEDEIELLKSDGFTDHIDSPEYNHCTLQTCWTDIFDMDEDAFYTKYFWDGSKKSLRVLDADMGGDEQLKKIAARMIYIMYYISQKNSGSDNTIVLLRKITGLSSPATTTTTTTATTSSTIKEINKTTLDEQPLNTPIKLDTMQPKIEKSGAMSWGRIGGGVFIFSLLGFLCYRFLFHQA